MINSACDIQQYNTATEIATCTVNVKRCAVGAPDSRTVPGSTHLDCSSKVAALKSALKEKGSILWTGKDIVRLHNQSMQASASRIICNSKALNPTIMTFA
eukprot:scaffold114820_cov55-Prasinocladus_malaysianus.AAC.2